VTRSPYAYPVFRADADGGGAADLQTDIMRFMAILALCLVAIFALVQSLPMQAPEQPTPAAIAAAPPAQPAPATPAPADTALPEAPAAAVMLERPPSPRPVEPPVIGPQIGEAQPVEARVVEAPRGPATVAPPTDPTQQGFSLRFESDRALTRLVAAGDVALYALEDGRARRMSVRDSRASFWDASTPSAYHEMEAATVPQAVVDALTRSGGSAAATDWGVTLPGRLKRALDRIVTEHSGGEIVIGSDGELRLEAT